jgi:hypothetical protein
MQNPALEKEVTAPPLDSHAITPLIFKARPNANTTTKNITAN